MDVTCPQCNTRYEFDEALVSSRGTTVKCTSCSHQFKVYRPKGAAELDGWTIRTVDGRELRYDAMRKLQAAITNGEITPDDVLIPGDGGEPKRLAKIEELKSFFRSVEAESDIGEDTIRRSSAPPQPAAEPAPSLAITRVVGSTSSGGDSSPGQDRDGEPLPSRTGDTLRPPSGAGSVPPDAHTIPRSAGVPDHERLASDAPTMVNEDRDGGTFGGASPKTVGRELHPLGISMSDEVTSLHRSKSRPVARPPQPREEHPSIRDDDTIGDPDSVLDEPPSAKAPAPREREESEYPSEEPESSGRDPSIAPLTPTPSVARPSILRRSEGHEEPRFTAYGPRGDDRPGLARWVVGIIAVGVLAVGGFALFNRYTSPSAAVPTASPADDRRVESLLEQGDEALASGEVETAKEAYLKASALADEDPRVARSLARIEIIRADQLWLYVRLLEEGSPHRKSLEEQLSRAVERAAAATQKAAEMAANDPLTVGLRIDVLRLEDEPKKARELVKALDGAGPDGGRALALLDLLEDEPNYSSVVDRLRTATRTERKLGRAHALLVYALAKAGRADDARRELEALETENPRHPLNAPLRAWVEGGDIPAPAPTPQDEPRPKARPRPERPTAVRRPPPEVVEPFATAEPDVHEVLPSDEDETTGDEPKSPPPEPSPETPQDSPPAPEPTPPPEPPPAEPPAPAPTSPPPIDTSDLPPE